MADRVGKYKRRMEATETNDEGGNSNSSTANNDAFTNNNGSSSNNNTQPTQNSQPKKLTFLKKKKKSFADSVPLQQKRENVVLNDAVNDPSSEIYKFLQTDRSLGLNRTFFYSLAIEPLKVRRERIIMLVEAFSIFGALFLNATWFIWEYGSSKDFDNSVLEKIFEIVCALGMIANVLLAMFSGFLWVQSVMFSSTVNNPNWVFACRHWLADMLLIQFLIFNFTTISLCLAVYNRLDGGIDALIIACGTAVLSFIYCQRGAYMWVEEIPLEFFHLPWYFKVVLNVPLIHKRKELRSSATKRAELLRKQADKELQKASSAVQVQKQQNQNQKPTTTSSKVKNTDEIESLLKEACKILGRNVDEIDLKQYVLKLQEDWFDTVESLQGLDVDRLHNYMPFRLAQTTYTLLENKKHKQNY